MSKPIPQFEIPGAEAAFNLLIETTIDWEKAQQQKQQAEADRAEAEKQQTEMQL